MANTVVQIKRSNTTSQPANLAYGELAYSLVSNNLFIGTDSNTIIKIGGGSDVALLNVTPGAVTGDKALIANSTGGLDNITFTNVVTTDLTTTANISAFNFTADTITANTTLTTSNLDVTSTANIVSLTANDIVVSNTLTVDGDIILRGDSITLGDGGDIISFGATVNSHIIPDANVTYDLGSSIGYWRMAYANQVTVGADPTAPLQVATKQYVDNIEAQLGGNSIIIGPPADGAYANGSGSGNVEGAVTSLESSTKISDAIDVLNEVILNVYNNTYVRDVVATCSVGNTGGAPLTSTLTINVVGNADRYDINWGDGTWTNNTTDSTPSHTYTDNTNSPFDVVVYARNTNALGEGNSASFTATDLITLFTGDPSAAFQIYNAVSGGSVITEANVGETIYVENDTTNSNGVVATFNIDWGDGSSESIANTSVEGGPEGARADHIYATGTGTGTNTITVSVNTHSTADPSSIPDSATRTIKIFDTAIGAPEGLSGKSFTLTSSSVSTGTPKLAFNHTDNSSESTLGVNDTVTRYTTSGAIQTSGEANSQVVYDASAGTLSAIVDGSVDGSITFDSSDNTGSNSSLVVVDELDFYNFSNTGTSVSASNRIHAPGLYSGFRARVSKSSVSTGLHTYKLSHSTTGNTSVLQFVKDNLTGTPVINFSGTTVSQNSAGTLAYVSGVPYYTNDAVLDVSGVLVSNVAGQVYRDTSTPFSIISGTNVESDSGSAFSTQTKGYSILPSATLNSSNPIANTGVGANVTIDDFTVNVNGGGRVVEGFAMNMNNINGTGDTVQHANTKIAVYNGNSSGVREDSIPVSSSLGAGFDTNGIRVDAFSSTNATPTFTNNTDYYVNNAWSGVVTVAGTDEAVVRYGNLQHYTTDLSTGYLPAGPDLNTGRSGSQYFRFAFKRTTMANFDLVLTGKVSGVFIAAPNTAIDSASGLNGWIDASTTYGGAGTPGSDTGNGGNGSDGCAFTSGDRIIDGTTYSNQSFTLTLGDQSATDAYNNQILVSIKLDDGDYLTKLEVQ